MKMKVQLIIEDKSGSTATTEIATLERGESDELIGLSLEEAKAITASVQRTLLEAQAREAIDRGSTCTQCKARLRGNGAHRVIYRTAFGRLTLASPRFYLCRCQMRGRQSVSPLAIWLHGHMSPELQYLEAQFAAQLSYGMSARILGSVLPLQQATSITTWKRHVARVGGRLDEEAHQRPASHPVLNEFGLPTRNPLRAVGIDGGYVIASDAPSRPGREPKLRTIPERIGARLSPAAVGNIFKSVAKCIKMASEDIRVVSGHSIRVGATQDLLALNIDLASVMQAGRWKTNRMPMRYGEHVLAARSGMARAAKEQGRDG
jgi:hypothetical protein